MISPQGYIEKHKDKSLEELVRERYKLIKTLREYEENNILNQNPPTFSGLIIDPSPEVVYSCYNDYLDAITNLIIEKQSNVKSNIDKVIDEKRNTDDIKSGILGFVVGDCLGVPVEFKTRYWLKENPVRDMLEKGSHFQPKGTWSDDTSMVLATIHSLVELKGYGNKSFYDIADKFVDWYKKGLYSPSGEVFDVGNTTKSALEKFIANRNKECGEDSLYDNGNGSLMRIIPLAYYFYKAHIELEQRKNITFEVSSITHNHIMSKYACLMYVEFLLNVLNRIDKYTSYKMMIDDIEMLLELEENKNKKIVREAYKRILNGKIDMLKEKDIKSTGYVVDTLEAVLWIVLNSKEYKEAVLKAVNLGDDTDTIAALAGGLLGAIYGYDSIPNEWIESIIRKDEILSICESMEKIKYEKSENYITIGGEVLNKRVISSKYEVLYKTLNKYRNYHKKLNIKETKKVDKKASQIIKELFELKILCRNYDEITRITTYELKESNTKEDDINKLNVLECLALITIIQRESYWDGGYTEVFYEYTKNEILPLLVNRILDNIEFGLRVDNTYVQKLITYLFYHTIVTIGGNGRLEDALEILKKDEIRQPKVLFREETEQAKYYNDLKKLFDIEYIIIKEKSLELIDGYLKKNKHKDLDSIINDETLLALVEEIVKVDIKVKEKEKLNREKVLEKLRKNRKSSGNMYVDIVNDLSIIEDELSKYYYIQNDDAILGIRQKFVVEEFDRYITSKEKMYIEDKYYQTYYDIEQFIEGAEYPADKYQNPEFKYSKYMSSKEVKILVSMIDRLKLECQKELNKQKNSSDKELILEIRHTNWGMIGPNDWTEVIWKVYKDLTVDIVKKYNRVEQSVENTIKKLTKKDYNTIIKNIELSKDNDIIVEACDGSAWELIQYENNKEIWKREQGYIYGIKTLEAIEKIVLKI